MREVWVHNTVAKMLDNDENNLVSGRYLTVANMQEVTWAMLPTDTASGAVASFPDGAAGAPLVSLSANIDPVQDLHGYDSPWPAGGGKNKIFVVPYSTDDYSPFSAALQPSVDVANQTITLNCAASGQTVLLYKHDFPTGQYTVSFNVTAYDKRSIVRCFDSSGNVLTDSDVRVTGGTWNSFYRGFYLKNGDGTFTVPDTVDHFWLGFGVSNDARDSTVTISKIMLEYGSTATSWEPYENICPISGWSAAEVNVNGETITHEFKDAQGNTLTVYGGADELIGGKLRVTRAYVDLATVPTWSNNMTGQNAVEVTGTPSPTKAPGRTNIISDILKTATNTSATDIAEFTVRGFPEGGSGSLVAVKVPATTASTVADAAAWIRETHPIAVYELATPLEYDLSREDIRTLYGDNTISADCGDVEVTYRADIGLYIDKKLASQNATLTNSMNNITVLDTVKAAFKKRG